ncbi:tetratricopeptide repeat protein [Crocosphaera sp.]|uniref:tetratricopeptide repeat protein n=1 Tax=Crocosphaera sp. TaxID=2729996 RepID=UPI002614F844|nr:tetratricopeptide repeat protein [Crocosphaera sp.]MDJ0582188.1 tetratricopeptide repeat protein [Crocosphaera sp.]
MDLHIRFTNTNDFVIKAEETESDRLDFAFPLTEEDFEELKWYWETYASSYLDEPDFERASQIEGKFTQWGSNLFNAVFNSRPAQRILNDFQDEEAKNKRIIISSSDPTVLALPWELLRDPDGTYLVHDNPSISIRRRFSIVGGGRKALKVKAKPQLRLLFIVSRPEGAGFFDPRGEAKAVMAAIEAEAKGKIEIEFLRPATLDKLVERLEDEDLPPIDIVHFDGHGVYDKDGKCYEDAKRSDPSLTKINEGIKQNTGYLLFEDKDGKTALISAETLGDMLNRRHIALMVLSACQSAQVTGEDAMGSVAARLTHAGIPSVLAMTYSVLVVTAQQLFRKFYERLVKGDSIGQALDKARRDLYLNRERGERQRGDERFTLRLYDWFLPALYQNGTEKALFSEGNREQATGNQFLQNLPYSMFRVSFCGRKRELWQIETAFVRRGTKRITIAGFGGQGKTALAVEAADWFCKTGLFNAACFVDYVAFQGIDAVGLAVTTLQNTLEQNFPNPEAVTEYLNSSHTPNSELRTPNSILLILDNLEALQTDSLSELLTVVQEWTDTGNCRVILTTRDATFNHPAYLSQGSWEHIVIPLKGLYPTDAVDYCLELLALPPAAAYPIPDKTILESLLRLLDFHPLSIQGLATELKYRRPNQLGERLEELIRETPDNPLLASLNLSLDRLDDKVKQWLPRLGVFQGGAMENMLLTITEVIEILANPSDEKRAEQINQATWLIVRQQLLATGLIQIEAVLGAKVPYIKIHPTLLSVLWQSLGESEPKNGLIKRHYQQYHQLSRYLYFQDDKNAETIRPTAIKELPNLLFAVHNALDVQDKNAIEFVSNIDRFLDYFGQNKKRNQLTQCLQNFEDDFLSQSTMGETLYSQGRYTEAEQVFRHLLQQLGEDISYDRSLTLGRLGRCLIDQGKVDEAIIYDNQGIALAQQLEATERVKRHIGVMQADLGNVLMLKGDYKEAKQAYETALAIKQELVDTRGEAATVAQLGTLAKNQGNLSEAEKRYKKALKAFQSLNESPMEAILWHQLGMVYQDANQWQAAETCYRNSAEIEINLGNLKDVAKTWNQLAVLCEFSGKPQDAELWYRKAMEGFKQADNKVNVAASLSGLAHLLQNQENRLEEAETLAEEALAISQTLDPNMGEIWKNYNILAEIADKQGDKDTARSYRRLMRQTKWNAPVNEYELQQWGDLIQWVLSATQDAEVRKKLNAEMQQFHSGWDNLVAAIRLFLNGERDEDILCDRLGHQESMIMMAIINGVAE